MRKSRSKTAGERHVAVNIAIGSGISLLLVLVLLMISAIFTSSGTIPENLMGAVVAISCFLAAVAGSRIVTGKVQDKKLIIGAAQGAFLFVLIFAIGRAASADAAFGSITLATLAASVAGGVLGGFGGRKRRRSVRR